MRVLSKSEEFEDLMRQRFAHVLFGGAFLQIGAHERGLDVLDRDDEIRRRPFGGIDEKKRALADLIFHPEGNDLIVAVQYFVDPDAPIRYLELGDLLRRPCDKDYGECGDDDDDGEKSVMQKHADDHDRDGDDAERPIPIGGAFDMLVLVCAPTKYRRRVGHSI